ncbi:hypothetical protein [Halorussus sp. GCM10023401]
MDGLEHYPAAGDVFSTWVRGTNNADRINITYGVQNHTNRYFARVNPEQGHVALYRYEDGNATLLTDKSVPLSQDTWYEVHIDWQTDGTHVFTLFDESGSQISQISATDSTWTAGGIGYDAYLDDGGTVYIDHTQIHSGREIVSANEVIDSFEDSDLAEYSFDRGSSGASVVSNPTYGGSSVLEISNDNTEMISTSGLDHYPSAGDVFSSWVRGTGGADDINFTYGVQDHTNRYFVRVDFANDNLKLYRYENASATLLEKQTSGFTLSEDTWYNVEVDWRKTGAHTATLYDCDGGQVAQITGTDSTWTSGGIGYDAYLGSSGGTVYFDYVAIHESVLDDFEDGDLSEYSGDTGSFTVQNSTVLEGNQTLKGTSTGSAIAHSVTETTRGNTYAAKVMAENGSNGKPALLAAVQDSSSPMQDCYYLEADSVNDQLKLYRQDSGTSNLLSEHSVSIEEETVYTLVINFQKSFVIGSIKDQSGTVLASMGRHDTTLTGGLLGLGLTGGSSGYFDSVRRADAEGRTLDNFRAGALSNYGGSTGAYSIQSSTVLNGVSSLKCENNYTGIAHQSLRSPRGYEYSCHIQAGTNSQSKPGLLACVQDPDNPIDNCYWASADTVNNKLSMFRRESGTSVALDRVDVEIKEGKEYQLAIQLLKNSIRAVLSDENGVFIAATKIVDDTTYQNGTFGFYTGGTGSPAYYDSVGRYPFVDRSLAEVTTSSSVAQDALNTTAAQEVLTELNNPTTDTTSAKRVNHFNANSGVDSFGIKVPIEYGNLGVVNPNSSSTTAIAYLDRSKMPQSLIDDLAGNLGWPTSIQDGFVEFSDGDSAPSFGRGVTDSKRSEIETLVSDNEGRMDDSVKINAWVDSDKEFYNAMYYDKRYHVDSGVTKIQEKHNIMEHETPSPLCVSFSITCINLRIIGLGDQAAGCIAGLEVCLRRLTKGRLNFPICGISIGFGCAGFDLPDPYACKAARRYCSNRRNRKRL